MAIYYVRPTGNDTTGDGSTGNPWATVSKGIGSIPDAANNELKIGTGTYAENSGSGYLSVNRSFANLIKISPESGRPGDVVIKGTGTAWGTIWSNATKQHFDGITFEAQAATVQAAARFVGVTLTDVTFTRCRFVAYSSSAANNLAFTVAWATAGLAVNGLTFSRCTFDQIDSHSADGAMFDATTGTAQNIAVHDCDFNVGGFGIRMLGVTDVSVIGNRINAWHPTSGRTGFQIGVDGAPSGRTTSGYIAGNRFRSHTGHGAVVGAGSDGVVFVGNTVIGGNNSSVGQGLVIKEAANAHIEGNDVRGGYLSGLYLKGAYGCTVVGNTIHNAYAASAALRVGVNNDSGQVAHDNTVRRNRFIVAAGTALDFGNATHDSGGSVVDENVYTLLGAATLGAVRGTTVATLTALRAAWSGYDRRNNDRNSRIGQGHVPSAGPRLIDLPA